MDFEKSKKFLFKIGIIYWILVMMIYSVANKQFRYIAATSNTIATNSIIGELVDGQIITQEIASPANSLLSLDIMTTKFYRNNDCKLSFVVSDESGNKIADQTIAASDVEEYGYTNITLDKIADVDVNEKLTLTITSENATVGNAIGFFYGNAVAAGRFDSVKNIASDEFYEINNETGFGSLCVKLNGYKYSNFYRTYWLITFGIFMVSFLYTVHSLKKARQGYNNYIVAICTLNNKYRFLLKQLVSRDFKVKYKRSTLGVAWSFINPLLTMIVQYIVFSTIFKSNTPNYPVYLLTGVVFFNFFNEAVNTGLVSITGNAALIKKVYVPKYIYPISKLFFSLINFGISLIPLALVMIITGLEFKISLLLLIFDILCFLGFVLGMMLLLSTSMTFFQDTQFLWSVVSMVWMYCTPLFYTESIIPSNMLTIFHMNPLYQYITFARTCIIDGVSPRPMSYLWCLLSSTIVFAIGLSVFKKNQDKFVLYI